MATPRYSAGEVLSSVFDEEDSFDDSGSESGDDIYAYLGEPMIPREELEEEARDLMEDRDDSSSADESVASILASNSEEVEEGRFEDTNSEEREEERVEDTRSSDGDSHSLHSSMEFASHSREHESEDMVVDAPSPILHTDEANSIDDRVVSEIT